jgi:putative phosphoesterase
MKKRLRLGILSDSHQETTLHQEAIAHLLACGAEHLLHAGDLETKEHLEMLASTPVPYTAVYGNNDMPLIPLYQKYNIHREPHYFKIEDLTIKMMHMPYYMNADANIIISGHSHIFDATLKGERLFINPGEVCAREKPLTECAMIEVFDGSFEVTHYFKKPSDTHWQSRAIDL